VTATREGAGKTALVTGASAGIGAAMARFLARHGFDLVLTARRADRLATLAHELHRAFGITARAWPGDLAVAQTCRQLVDALERDGIAIDFLVNNAGYGIHERFYETSWETQRDFVQVMVAAPCELVHRLLPGMMERGYGRIINVASVAGFLPGVRGNTMYGASKAFLISFSQSLHSEQRGKGVHVTALCPGLTYTEFHDVTGTRSRMQRLPKILWLNADRVVEEGYQAVMRNQATCVPGLQYRAIISLVRRLPLRLAHRIAATH
jgi:uncharacterized protein